MDSYKVKVAYSQTLLTVSRVHQDDAEDYEPDAVVWLEGISSEHHPELDTQDFEIWVSAPRPVPLSDLKERTDNFQLVLEEQPLDDSEVLIACATEWTLSVKIAVPAGTDPTEVEAGISWSDWVTSTENDESIIDYCWDDRSWRVATSIAT